MLWIWTKVTEPEDYTECLSFPVSESCHWMGSRNAHVHQEMHTQQVVASVKVLCQLSQDQPADYIFQKAFNLSVSHADGGTQ